MKMVCLGLPSFQFKSVLGSGLETSHCFSPLDYFMLEL